MRHKEFVITRIEAQMNLLENLKKVLDGNVISKPEALQMLTNIHRNLEAVVERIDLEPNE